MAEITQAEQTQPSHAEPAMPTGQQTTTSQDASVQPSSQQAAEPAQGQADNDELAQEVSDRTRMQFDRLREQLRTERDKAASLQSTLQTYQRPENTEPVLPPIYDPTTGLLNEQAFSKTQQATQQALKEAQAARVAAQNTQASYQKYMSDLENQEAYTAHPELNPTDKKTFSKDLHVQTRRILLDSMLNPQDYNGKQLSFKQAGDLAKQVMSKDIQKVEEQARVQGATEAIESLTPKEQASLEAVGSPANRQQTETDHESLRAQTRYGGEAGVQAIMARMAANRKAKG